MMKKKFSLLVLFLCLVVVSLVSFTDGAEYGRGDVNKDGRVDMDDLTVLVNYLLTNQWPTDDAHLPYGSKSFYLNGVGFSLIPIEGGTFTMGATEEHTADADEDEYPAHEVTVSSFYMSQIEVTRQLWLEVMGTTPGHFSCGFCRPVTHVSWNDCQEFIAKLNELTHSSFRLPTEAEWEYAARGGKLTHSYLYAGSDNIEEVAWYGGNPAGNISHNVAMKKDNELQLFDMTGNVREWCQDYYGPYSSEPQTDPTGPESGYYRVVRGGSYTDRVAWCRVARRFHNSPNTTSYYIGFRLVLSE